MTKSLVIATALLLAAQCLATEDPAPPITREGLVGVWEGIAGQKQLYRMELSSGDDGYLAFMADTDGRQQAAIFRLTSAIVSAGRVHLEFRNLAAESFASERASIDGSGFASDSIGGISGKLIFRGGSNDGFDIFFLKGAISRTLASMSKRAEQLIADARAKHHP